jgi:hypothetical protein
VAGRCRRCRSGRRTSFPTNSPVARQVSASSSISER